MVEVEHFKTMEDKLISLEKEVSKKADKEQLRTLDDKLQEKDDKVEIKQIEGRLQNTEEKMSQKQQFLNDKLNSESDTAAGPTHGDKINHIVNRNIDEKKAGIEERKTL